MKSSLNLLLVASIGLSATTHLRGSNMHLGRRAATGALLIVSALLGVPVSVVHAEAATTGAGSAAASSEASHWSRVAGVVPRFQGARQSVSCVSLSHCTAVDDAGNASVFNGDKWTGLHSADRHLGPLASISCPTATFCAAVGGVREVVEKNGSWGRVHVAPANLTSVSCWAESRCRAVGDDGTTMRYDGSRHPGPNAATANLAVASCPTRDFCMAMDAHGASYKFHDGRWIATGAALPDLTLPGPGASVSVEAMSLECATTHLCMAATAFTWVSRWDSTTWKMLQLQPNSLSFSAAVSCSGPAYCAWVTHGGNFAAWRHGWGPVSHHRHVGGGDAYPPPFDCPAKARCLLIGGLATTTMRPEFHRFPTPPAPFIEPRVDCPTSGTCVSVNEAFKPRLFHHGKWTPQAISRDQFPRGHVSCGSTTFCVALDGQDSRAYLWRGHTWTFGHALPYEDGWALSCASPDYCLAVGEHEDGGNVDVVWNGSNWSEVVSNGSKAGVQCAADADCWSLGGGFVSHWDGTTWSTQQRILDSGRALACPTTDFCVAADDSGSVAYYRDGVWSAGEQVGPMTYLSCASPTSCVGMLNDQPGFDATFDGTRWTIARALPKGYGATITDISCAGQGTCMLVDQDGNAFRRTA